ncbi:MaoC/PaaZ C-terminal domain-containing protein [Xanthobacter autotrophicus DSM 431]|uniref:MaoC/PaaZ C-terminal domain-containing protein n=1 Tax=Xanthobacter nonsaccharivorans TaxID=3119912 RepID=UPI00372A95BC
MAEGAGLREIGRFTFTADEIKRFAGAFDPQPFHMDEAAGAASPFGGLVASGWHTACVWMGLFVRAHGAAAEGLPASHAAVIAPVGVGFGMTDLKWLAPVRAGDTLVFFTEVLEARPSGSRPGWTIYHRRGSARREDGTEVLSFELRHLAPDGTA